MLPHNTAVIIEKISGDEFVVDSWFFDNGTPPVIVPLESWLAGYDPIWQVNGVWEVDREGKPQILQPEYFCKRDHPLSLIII